MDRASDCGSGGRRFNSSWAQMKIIFYFSIFMMMCLSLQAEENDSAYYLKQNEDLKTLEQFKDSPEMINAKLKEVENINFYRSHLNKRPVKFDILASRVANMQCYNAAVNGYMGHWDMNGFKPYIRYSLAGGKDHVSENASGQYEIGMAAPVMEDTDRALDYMKTGLKEFMSEGPGGGHYENVINVYHNYVGIGYFCTNIGGTNQIRYYEEYIDRYIEWDDFPLTCGTGNKFLISGRVNAKDAGVFAVIVFFENFPRKMSPSEISAISTYPDYTSNVYRQLWPWNIDFDSDSQRFKIPLKFDKPGFYYLHVMLKKGISSIPYNKPVSVSTEGLVNASGVVIQVR